MVELSRNLDTLPLPQLIPQRIHAVGPQNLLALRLQSMRKLVANIRPIFSHKTVNQSFDFWIVRAVLVQGKSSCLQEVEDGENA